MVLVYGINSILYQRGVYPAETFKKAQQYGLTLLTTGDEKLNSFLKSLTQQIEGKMAVLNFPNCCQLAFGLQI